MGSLERDTNRRRRKENIQKAILATIATAGLLAVVLVAPNMIKIFGKSLTKINKSNFKRSQDKLLKQGLIAVVRKGDKKYLRVTNKGHMKLRQIGVVDTRLVRTKRWDGKWRLLSFDIWESRRLVREKLRTMLKRLGFLKLHQSLWICPYDCEELINLIKLDLKLSKGVLYIIADQVEGDFKLRKYFSLD